MRDAVISWQKFQINLVILVASHSIIGNVHCIKRVELGKLEKEEAFSQLLIIKAEELPQFSLALAMASAADLKIGTIGR